MCSEDFDDECERATAEKLNKWFYHFRGGEIGYFSLNLLHSGPIDQVQIG